MCMKADKGGAVGTTFKGFTMEEATDYMCLTHQPERVFIANHKSMIHFCGAVEYELTDDHGYVPRAGSKLNFIGALVKMVSRVQQQGGYATDNVTNGEVVVRYALMTEIFADEIYRVAALKYLFRNAIPVSAWGHNYRAATGDEVPTPNKITWTKHDMP